MNRPAQGDSTDVPRESRRRFLTQIGLATAGGLLLSGCHSGCASETSRTPPRVTTGTGEDRVTPPEAPKPPWRPEIPRAEPTIRVRVMAVRRATGARDDSTEHIAIEAPGNWVHVREAAASGSDRRFTLRSPVQVRRRDERWEIVDAGGFEAPFDGERSLQCSAGDSAAAVLRIGAIDYPGTLRLVPVATDLSSAPSPPEGEIERGGEPGSTPVTSAPLDAFDIVNHLPLEMYLPGVLAKELYSHWHAETFAAQAIAARSFACMEAQFNAARRHFDVTNTQSSQAYVGRTSLTTALDAAALTRGVVLAWEQKLVPGYYSSCCGGVAANASDAIASNAVNDIVPLRSRSGPDACTGAPVYRWTNRRTVVETSRRIAAWGSVMNDRAAKNLLDIRAIAVESLNAHGRPTTFRFTDVRDASVVIPAKRMRDAIDFTGQGLQAPREPLRSSFLTAEVAGRDIIFHGRGFGHGVGLCQYGAEALAGRGVRHREMLAQFYPGAALVGGYA